MCPEFTAQIYISQFTASNTLLKEKVRTTAQSCRSGINPLILPRASSRKAMMIRDQAIL
jgi:hypothetical protein